MGIVILSICSISLLGIITYIFTKEKKDKFNNMCFVITIFSIFTIAVLVIVVAASYSSYLSLKQDKIAIQQCEKAINLYLSKANIEMRSDAMTDFKYNRFQKSLLHLIKDYRWFVNRYNNNLIAKRELDNSFMFGLIIIGPDSDMKIINIKEY